MKSQKLKKHRISSIDPSGHFWRLPYCGLKSLIVFLQKVSLRLDNDFLEFSALFNIKVPRYCRGTPPPLCNITDIRTYARVKGDEKGVRGKSIKHKRHKT